MPQGYLASHFLLRWWQGMHAFLARLRLRVATIADMATSWGRVYLSANSCGEHPQEYSVLVRLIARSRLHLGKVLKN